MWLKEIGSRILLKEFPMLRKRFWGEEFLGERYFAVFGETISDEMIQKYTDEQEGEPVIADDDQARVSWIGRRYPNAVSTPFLRGVVGRGLLKYTLVGG